MINYETQFSSLFLNAEATTHALDWVIKISCILYIHYLGVFKRRFNLA